MAQGDVQCPPSGNMRVRHKVSPTNRKGLMSPQGALERHRALQRDTGKEMEIREEKCPTLTEKKTQFKSSWGQKKQVGWPSEGRVRDPSSLSSSQPSFHRKCPGKVIDGESHTFGFLWKDSSNHSLLPLSTFDGQGYKGKGMWRCLEEFITENQVFFICVFTQYLWAAYYGTGTVICTKDKTLVKTPLHPHPPGVFDPWGEHQFIK